MVCGGFSIGSGTIIPHWFSKVFDDVRWIAGEFRWTFGELRGDSGAFRWISWVCEVSRGGMCSLIVEHQLLTIVGGQSKFASQNLYTAFSELCCRSQQLL